MIPPRTSLVASVFGAAASASAPCPDLDQCNHVDAGEPGSRNAGARLAEGFPEPVAISGEMIHLGGLGATKYVAQAAPGRVSAMVRGEFSSRGRSRGYRPSATAVANSLYVVEGPAGARANISFNLDFAGSQSLTGVTNALAADLRTTARVDIGTTGTHHCDITRARDRTGEPKCGIGIAGAFASDLAEERVGDVSFFEPREGHLTTPSYAFEPGRYAFRFYLQVVADFLTSGHAEKAVFHNAFDRTLSFAHEGPVANLPDGWSFHGPGVVNNRLAQHPGTPFPEPSTAMLALSGLMLVASKLRKARRSDRDDAVGSRIGAG